MRSTLDGVTYHWSKHFEFMKVLDLPQPDVGAARAWRSSSYRDEDRTMLEQHGWRVRPGLGFSADLDAYRTFIQLSRGEFSVAKDQNVRLRSGWFSERSATYLAAGRPVILQDTGFGSYLPTGRGAALLPDLDECGSRARGGRRRLRNVTRAPRRRSPASTSTRNASCSRSIDRVALPSASAQAAL